MVKVTIQKRKVLYSNKELYLKRYTKTTRHNNLKILFAKVRKFPSSLDLALKTNFQNKAKGLAYMKKYELTFSIIFESVTCHELSNYSFLLNDG